MNTTYIDLHVLQTVPPSNINRDDTGSPKSAVFGGVRRARVSSQAWKRATRQDFSTYLDESKLGERTKLVAERIAERVTGLDRNLEERALDLSVEALKAAGIKTAKTKVKVGAEEEIEQVRTGALLFASRPQIQAVAELIVDNPDEKFDKKAVKKALEDGVSVDVALFGRMIADAPDLNVDACAQVAHAISVHGVDNEYDYFTAVDDNAVDENAGADMIGTVEFNSSTLYRYATVNVHELTRVLGSVDAAREAVEAFVRSFITSMPTGKQNTFANRTLPDFVMLSVREDQPVNLVGAFETPIRTENGRPEAAARALLDYAATTYEVYDSAPVEEYAIAVGEAAKPLEQSHTSVAESLATLVEHAGDAVMERCGE